MLESIEVDGDNKASLIAEFARQKGPGCSRGLADALSIPRARGKEPLNGRQWW